MFRMPDQRATSDQIDYLVDLLDDVEAPQVAALVRERKPLNPETIAFASKIAVLHGLYDADDWLKRQLPEEDD